MKTTLKWLFGSLLFLSAMNAQAQDAPSYRHSVRAGIGLWAAFGHYDPYYDQERNLQDEKMKRSLIPNICYQYMMNRHWSLGGTVSMGRSRQYMRYIDSGEIADEKGDTFFSMLFTTRYYWRTKNWVKTYSGIGLGVAYDWEKKYEPWNDKQHLYLSGQLTVLGIEVGKGHLFGYGEFGLGATGWLQGGIGYRF